MKIFVTGCAGLLGSNYARHLISSGHEVIGLITYLVDIKRLFQREKNLLLLNLT